MKLRSMLIFRVTDRAVAVSLGCGILAAILVSCGGAPPDARPHDDLTHFISRFGAPDSTYSSEFEQPRPAVVTKWLIYEEENVRVVYVPDASVGDSPPYDTWKFMGFQDHKTNEVMEPSTAVERLAERDSWAKSQ